MELFLNPKFQCFDDNGNPLSGGKVYTYESGTTTPKTTYSDRTLSTANANPVVLDSRGEAVIYFSSTMKIVVKDSDDTTIYTLDNLHAASVSTYIEDNDQDTKIQVEESADEDKIRMDTAGTERLVIDTLIRPKVAIEMEGVAIQDADGDTKIQVEEGSDDDDTIRLDCAGAEQVTIQDGKIEPTVDDDIDLGSSGKQFKDAYIDGIAYISELAEANAGEKITCSHNLKVDTVEEKTADTGVTLDGVLLKDGKVGTDHVDQASIEADAVGQSELKESLANAFYTGADGANTAMTGGLYCFYMQTKVDNGTGQAQIAKDFTNTSYATQIYLGNTASNHTTRAQWYYIIASGEIAWLWMLRDSVSKFVKTAQIAPDHISMGNGPLGIGNPDLIQHPFVDYWEDPSLLVTDGLEIIVSTFTPAEFRLIVKEAIKRGRDLLEIIEGLYELVETGPQKQWPTIPVTVGLERDAFGGKTGRVIKKAVPKPPMVTHRRLRLKGTP